MKWRRVIWSLLLAAFAIVIVLLWREHRRESHYAPQIETAARRYGLDPLLVKAVVWRESRFDASTRGKKGEIGLMQLRQDAANEWAAHEGITGFKHEHCFDPATNTFAGAFYLSKRIERYADTDNPLPYALADYNAGRSNVLKWKTGAGATNSAVFIQQIGFPSTKTYVKTVMRRYSRYQFLAGLGWN